VSVGEAVNATKQAKPSAGRVKGVNFIVFPLKGRWLY
jgi:hypothetical protein